MVDAYRSEEPAVIAATGSASLSSYVDWPAIFAGTLLATAVSFVLNTFGAAIGLSVVSPFDRDGIGGTGLLIAVALWVIWVTVSSFMAGAYVAGRMRRRSHDASEHESDVRDGVHGLTVWALGILLSAFVFASGVGTAVRAGADAASGAADSATAAAGGEESYDYAVGRLFRPGTEGAAPQPSEGRRALQAEFTAILTATAARGEAEIAADDKAYMTSAVAAETGVDAQQAAARVEELANGYREAVVAAKEATDTARVASVLAAFVLAAALLIAGAGAWWAAGVGGNHRDEETVLGFFGRRG